jgi:hypothetical protein
MVWGSIDWRCGTGAHNRLPVVQQKERGNQAMFAHATLQHHTTCAVHTETRHTSDIDISSFPFLSILNSCKKK